MAAESSTQGQSPTLVERLLDRQREAWRRGERVVVEVLLRDHPTVADDRERLLTFVWSEVELRAARGEAPQLDEYQKRFPALGDDLRRRWESGRTLSLSARGADATLEGESGAPVIPSPTPPVLPGIPGYEIRRELGKGGMGVVYEAWQPSLNRVVALKMILGGFADDEARSRILTEAHAIAALQHPNVVQVFEVGEHGGAPFFSLEFCAGGSLEGRLKASPLPPAEAARLVETLARAVHHAHVKGVIHRDLKPANVLLTADGTPKVTDFGLARKLDEAGRTQTGAVMGTPSYMAPEQAAGKGKEIGPAADVYALGAILYECLTGRPPFKAATVLDTLMQVRNDDPVPPRQLQSRTPRDLETVCLKCLQKDSGKRYGGAAALAEDLRRFQAGEPIAARPVGVRERAVKWVRRRPAAAGFMALFVGALLAGTGVSTYFALDARQRQKETKDAFGKLTDQDRQINKDKDDLEKSVARGLLRPIGHQAGVVTGPEIDALWELAGSTDRVRLSFVEQALSSLKSIRQMRNRADMAVHAAVGLAPERRLTVETLLLTRLRDESADADVGTDCVFIGVGLDDWSPEFAGAAARRVVEAMPKTANHDELTALAGALSALAPRLEPAAAAAAADRVLDDMTETNDWSTLSVLAGGLSALAPQLEPAEASAAAGRVVDAMDKTNDWPTLSVLAGALSALAPRLEPAEAARRASAAARRVERAMDKSDDTQELTARAGVLAALAPRLEPAEAARRTSAAARQVEEAMDKTADSEALADLAGALSALAPQLEPAEASAAAGRVVEAMDKKLNGRYALFRLAGALAALAPRQEPVEASRRASAAARRVVDAMDKTAGSEDLAYLAGALAALAPRLEPAEASRRASAAARRVEDAMDKSDNSQELSGLAGALAALAPRLEPAEASAAARRVEDAMDKQMNVPYALPDLAGALAALAPRLEPAEASAAAGWIVDAMENRINYPFALADLAGALAALAPRLEPAEAARRASVAGRRVVRAMDKSDNFHELAALAGALAVLAPRLEPAEASAAAGRVVDVIPRTYDPEALLALAGALAALAPRLEPAEAARQASAAADRATADLIQSHSPYELSALADVVAALIVRVEPGGTSERTRSLALAVGTANTPPTLLAGLGPLAEASRPLPGRFTEQQLVDRLKTPTCRQEARQVIVRQLGWQCGRHFDTMWGFVKWAKANRPDLDLDSPPRRGDLP